MTNLFRIFLISLASAVAWFRGSGADWGAVSPVPRKLKPPVVRTSSVLQSLLPGRLWEGRAAPLTRETPTFGLILNCNLIWNCFKCKRARPCPERVPRDGAGTPAWRAPRDRASIPKEGIPRDRGYPGMADTPE